MPNERPHPSRDSGDAGPRFVAWFLGLVAGVYVLQAVLLIWFNNDTLTRLAVLSGNNLRSGRFWTPLTHALVHHSPLHLLLNLGGAYILLRHLDEQLSRAHLVGLSIATALGGAALWLAFHLGHHGHVLGASAIIMGYLTVFVCLDPREPIHLIPWPRYTLLLVLGGLDLVGLFARELPLGLAHHPISHSAHVGGMLAGWLYYLLALRKNAWSARLSALFRRPTAVEPPAWQRRPRATRDTVSRVNLAPHPAPATYAQAASFSGSTEELRAEVDRILDKMNLHGAAALTAAEQRLLAQAGRQFSHQ
jgi:membrane associated rhomboid family serine protease